MQTPSPSPEVGTVTRGRQLQAYAVHLFTALGVLFAFLAVVEVCAPQPDARWVWVWLIVAVLIDAIDGPLARRWHVKRYAPYIDGRTIDDIVDYLTYTFVPLVLVWRLEWVLAPAGLWVTLAMIASLFGFANTRAKLEDEGFFLGFPSYWNVFAFYTGWWFTQYGPVAPTVCLLVLTVLTILPVRFVYPNLAPYPWRWPLLIASVVWLALLLATLPLYPSAPAWYMWVSLVYPLLYTGLSVYLMLMSSPNRRHQWGL